MRIRWLVAGWALASTVRRLSQRTGVIDAEAYGTLPGDDVIPHPMVEWTRGVTVQAAPERIWPWLVQMGYGRAGWYTPAWVDRIIEPTLFQLKTRSPRSPDRLLPEFQSLSVGDLIADGPDYRSYWRVLAVEPQRAIVYHSVRHLWRPHPFDPSDPAAMGRVEAQLIADGVYLDCTWTFVLQPVGAERTRLLVRTRGNYPSGCSGWSCRRWGCSTPAMGWRSCGPSAAGLKCWPPRPQRRAGLRRRPPVTEHRTPSARCPAATSRQPRPAPQARPALELIREPGPAWSTQRGPGPAFPRRRHRCRRLGRLGPEVRTAAARLWSTNDPSGSFPLPWEVEDAPGAEGWQSMYPYFTRFQPEDDERFWFYNGTFLRS